MGQARQREGVERDDARDAVGALLDEGPRLRRPGVVDEDADAGIFAQAGFDPGKVLGQGEIGLQHLDGHAVSLGQAAGQPVKARPVAGYQHQVMATTGKTLGVGSADTGRSTSDENSGKGSHGVALSMGG